MFLCGVLAAISTVLVGHTPRQERASAVDVEFSLRRAAAGEDGFSERSFERYLAGRVVEPWRKSLAILDAGYRVGQRDIYALDWLASTCQCSASQRRCDAPATRRVVQ